MINNRLVGDKCYYDPISTEDTKLVLKWRNSDHVRNNFLHRNLITEEEHENWLKTQVETGKVEQFIIIEKDTDTPIGSVYLQKINYDEGSAEYGVFIGEKEALGKGYGTDAINTIVNYGFETLKLSVIYLRVLECNKSAIHVYEKAGFVRDNSKSEFLLSDKKERIVFYQLKKGANS